MICIVTFTAKLSLFVYLKKIVVFENLKMYRGKGEKLFMEESNGLQRSI